MAKLTTWEADKGGYFQGTATPGQVVGRAVDWAIGKVGKLPKIPKPESNKDHWTTWAEGKPLGITDAWLNQMIADGRLPTREQVDYRGNREDRAEMLAWTSRIVGLVPAPVQNFTR